MTIRLLLSFLLVALTLASTSCRSAKQPKEPALTASEMEASFRQRWIEKRVSELAPAGQNQAAARAQAEKEFSERYDFSRPGAKK